MRNSSVTLSSSSRSTTCRALRSNSSFCLSASLIASLLQTLHSMYCNLYHFNNYINLSYKVLLQKVNKHTFSPHPLLKSPEFLYHLKFRTNILLKYKNKNFEEKFHLYILPFFFDFEARIFLVASMLVFSKQNSFRLRHSTTASSQLHASFRCSFWTCGAAYWKYSCKWARFCNFYLAK